MTSFVYLHIPRMEISHANFLTCWWAISTPGPWAAVGFSHNLGLKAGFNVDSVALIHHDAQPLIESIGGYALAPQQIKGASLIAEGTTGQPTSDYSKGSMNLSLQPSVKGHLTVSLLVKIPFSEVIDLDSVNAYLYSAKFAGGQVLAHGKVAVYDSISKAAQNIKTGFSVLNRQDVVESLMAEKGITAIEAILEATSSNNPNRLPWASVSVMGYCPVSPFSVKKHVREGYAHAYAEPAVGLIQYVPARSQFEFFKYHQSIDNFLIQGEIYNVN